MNTCPQCRQRLPANSPKDTFGQAALAGVSGEGSSDDVQWSAVARVTNPAEVGFFADVLESAGFRTNVHQHNAFNAIDGGWATEFILRVPQSDSQNAVDALRTELEQYEDEGDAETPLEGEYAFEPPDAERATANRGFTWTPVVLMLVAGGLAYVAGRHSVGPVRQPPAQDSLRQALAESPAPLVGRDERGRNRRLRYDPNSGQIVLEDDADRDGRFELRRRFRGID